MTKTIWENPMMRGRFPLGPVVATTLALAALEESGEHLGTFLIRHITGDWGELSEEDRKVNDYSLAHGLRLHSSYRLKNDVELWIMTEGDRSSTTLLLPSEY